ncbi:uncharacterized protein ACIB01_008560 [Guaruba guarouba]
MDPAARLRLSAPLHFAPSRGPSTLLPLHRPLLPGHKGHNPLNPRVFKAVFHPSCSFSPADNCSVPVLVPGSHAGFRGPTAASSGKGSESILTNASCHILKSVCTSTCADVIRLRKYPWKANTGLNVVQTASSLKEKALWRVRAPCPERPAHGSSTAGASRAALFEIRQFRAETDPEFQPKRGNAVAGPGPAACTSPGAADTVSVPPPRGRGPLPEREQLHGGARLPIGRSRRAAPPPSLSRLSHWAVPRGQSDLTPPSRAGPPVRKWLLGRLKGPLANGEAASWRARGTQRPAPRRRRGCRGRREGRSGRCRGPAGVVLPPPPPGRSPSPAGGSLAGKLRRARQAAEERGVPPLPVPRFCKQRSPLLASGYELLCKMNCVRLLVHRFKFTSSCLGRWLGLVHSSRLLDDYTFMQNLESSCLDSFLFSKDVLPNHVSVAAALYCQAL